MKRDIVKIDEDLCNGCGDCIPNCHEGALQIVDDKAVLVSDLMCDGLGACIGHCPLGAISIEQREAEAYDEVAVMKDMVSKGKNTVIAHLSHLKEHNEHDFMKQGLNYLKENQQSLDFSLSEVTAAVHAGQQQEQPASCPSGGCPGSAPVSINTDDNLGSNAGSVRSELTQWPVQFHLINPSASNFNNADVLLAADCVAFSMGNFHQDHLKGKQLIIACPKLDSNQDMYLLKLIQLINQAKVNTITVMIMEVPCCGGLRSLAEKALQQASRKIPVKEIVVSIQGEILSEEWI